jgi:hypothetical protein
MMAGPKTIAGEHGTVSERSFVMVSFPFHLFLVENMEEADEVDQA